MDYVRSSANDADRALGESAGVRGDGYVRSTRNRRCVQRCVGARTLDTCERLWVGGLGYDHEHQPPPVHAAHNITSRKTHARLTFTSLGVGRPTTWSRTCGWPRVDSQRPSIHGQPRVRTRTTGGRQVDSYARVSSWACSLLACSPIDGRALSQKAGGLVKTLESVRGIDCATASECRETRSAPSCAAPRLASVACGLPQQPLRRPPALSRRRPRHAPCRAPSPSTYLPSTMPSLPSTPPPSSTSPSMTPPTSRTTISSTSASAKPGLGSEAATLPSPPPPSMRYVCLCPPRSLSHLTPDPPPLLPGSLVSRRSNRRPVLRRLPSCRARPRREGDGPDPRLRPRCVLASLRCFFSTPERTANPLRRLKIPLSCRSTVHGEVSHVH